ncbi:MAG: exodeoxyribonuclease VII large subunit [Candidatus Omnitrophica bacterium]|nr:exodeoxyribonuclease VII large subunit [Candidatus Omnitrophota bacterium]
MPEANNRHVYSVSELTRNIKLILEDNFQQVWLEGEISNFSTPSSGHIYLTLKDENAQVKAVIFRGTASRVKFKLKDGLKVTACGRITVYERSGQYQIIIDVVEPQGLGALQLAFQQLKEKLSKEGFFDQNRKKPLPLLPRTIGVITSPTGAAIRDIINVLTRRFPNIEIILYPVKVQGQGSAEEIAEGIEQFNKLKNVDVLIVGRGGGSLEDLWSFNEEVVARAIFASSIPVISAVGHEIDWTIADFTADKRAPTPSAAAETAVPDKKDLVLRIDNNFSRLNFALQKCVDQARNKLEHLKDSYVFRQPADMILQYQQRVDDLIRQINTTFSYSLTLAGQGLKSLCAQLESLSPLSILSRGYSVSLKMPEARILRDISELKTGDKIETRLNKGKILSKVEELT